MSRGRVSGLLLSLFSSIAVAAPADSSAQCATGGQGVSSARLRH
jgi:hypothetical protein